MNLDELAHGVGSDDPVTFRSRYPEPALVFLIPQDRETKTPSGGERRSALDLLGGTSKVKTDAHPDLTKKTTMSETQEGEAPKRRYTLAGESEVVFVKKTGRNPFENMVTVGRAPNNDVWLPVPSVSKMHAYFSGSPKDGWKLTDQKSSNGTTADDEPLPDGRAVPVPDGTRLGFGPDVKARFYSPEGLFTFLNSYRTAARAN
jgi:pSer/pThr/pTyr-binding forkhead associated (FHA) protein